MVDWAWSDPEAVEEVMRKSDEPNSTEDDKDTESGEGQDGDKKDDVRDFPLNCYGCVGSTEILEKDEER